MMLALKLGRTLMELTESMSSSEFSLWAELYRLDRWGQKQLDEQEDYRFGLVCATVANYAGMTRSKSAGPASPQDFMPLREIPEVEEPDPITFFKAVATCKGFDRKG